MAEDDLVERNLRWLLKNREDQREGNLCVSVRDIIYVRTGLSGLKMSIKLEINIFFGV